MKTYYVIILCVKVKAFDDISYHLSKHGQFNETFNFKFCF